MESFLVPTGALGSDEHQMETLEYALKNDPAIAERLLKSSYYQKLLYAIITGSYESIREGITWIVELLPHSPRAALEALKAYTQVHIMYLPDGRIWGLGDATAIIRAHYFSTDKKVATSVLNSLKPIDLEHLVESLYHAMGFLTKMTKPSHDGGVDIIAEKKEPGRREKI